MKYLVLSSLVLGFSAVAAPNHQVLQARVTVDAHKLSCITPVGGEAYTQLGDDTAIFRADRPHILELEHKRAVAEGCDMTKLSAIVTLANKRFGFIYGAPLTVTKDVGASYRNSAGECIADYTETATVDIGQGLSVSSALFATRPASDCN